MVLEHPFVIDELKKFLQRQWMDIATGRAIKFQAALAQPSLDLAENEVCVPRMPDGAELIVTRSPLVNSNGVITLTNRHLPQLMRLEGTIHIHPETAAKHLQADFDGDRLAFERADKYPTLTAEIKEPLLPENRYPDVVKRDKVPYQSSPVGWVSDSVTHRARVKLKHLYPVFEEEESGESIAPN
jgi:hypothetical protein